MFGSTPLSHSWSTMDAYELIPKVADWSRLDDRSWVHGFGAGARIAGPVEDYNLVQAIRVFYGSTEAELGVTDEAWMQLPIDKETAGVINDGLKILYDPDGCLNDAATYAARMFE